MSPDVHTGKIPTIKISIRFALASVAWLYPGPVVCARLRVVCKQVEVVVRVNIDLFGCVCVRRPVSVCQTAAAAADSFFESKT